MKTILEIFGGIFGFSLLFAFIAGVLSLFPIVRNSLPFQITGATAGIIIFIGALIPVIIGGVLLISYICYFLWKHE